MSVSARFQRNKEGLCTGLIANDGESATVGDFIEISYSAMVARLVAWAQALGTRELSLQESRPGLMPHVVELEKPLVDLLMTDVMEGLKQMNPATRTIDMRVSRPQYEDAGRVLVTGHAKLRNVQGKHVYFRRREEQYESPLTSLWEPIPEWATRIDSRWCRTSIEQLLAIPSEQYYIPRAWNQSKNWWIPRAELALVQQQLQEEEKSYGSI
jgi:hypothetical protein